MGKQKERNQISARFWIPKIERNMQRDIEVNNKLRSEGWLVLRFWGNEIKKNVIACADEIEKAWRERND